MHQINAKVTSPRVHATVAMLDFILEVLFVDVVELAAVLSEADAVARLVIKTVLTDVTGPDGPWLIMVLREADVTV
jgi:hypothetical protein